MIDTTPEITLRDGYDKDASVNVLSTVWSEKGSWFDRVPRSVAVAGIFVVGVSFWQLVFLTGLVSPIILPSPLETVGQLIFVGHNLITGGYMLASLSVTMQEVFYAFILSISIGFSLGVIVGESSFGERALMPYLVAFDTMPKVAFAPLFIAWLGFGIESKVRTLSS